MAVPQGKVVRWSNYNKTISMVELKRHVSNLIVIHPSEGAVKDEDTGHKGECTAERGVGADFSCSNNTKR